MADEKKNAVTNAKTSETAKSDKKDKTAKKDKTPSKFSPKNIFKGIGRFFKDLRGEIKKIVWPSRQMVIKSTGIVLAVILVIGAGIWLLDFALSGAVTGLNRLATETTEVVEEDEADDSAEKEDKDEAADESTTGA